MVDGWTRTCPRCGTAHGAKVTVVAMPPRFQCDCGHAWPNTGMRPVFLVRPPGPDAGDDAVEALIAELVARLDAAPPVYENPPAVNGPLEPS